MKFREIDKSNQLDCITLTVDKNQEHFVADNKQSLVEAAFEDGLYTLGIYNEETMVGFIMYDYDETFPGWSMSRFMIGKQYQGKGYGKKAVLEFLDYFKRKHKTDKIYISVSLENIVARKMYSDIGFKEIKEIEYTFLNMYFKEMQMIKELQQKSKFQFSGQEYQETECIEFFDTLRFGFWCFLNNFLTGGSI